ncbi:hypothetical protein SLS56_011987 [Neofusicoccum ribis]|uniref:SAP domain-containing protein n=1 Tax=Neofusicoccum ribis TaxID=45134 RepID=A0ABR3SB44_9PEZI
MTDYAKMKNAELEALLKQRSLPHTGKKADMVARLQEADKADAEKAPADKSAASTTVPPEDEIDWDDDTTDTKPAAAAAAAEATTEAGAAAIKAGGQGAVANPQAVPNQVADVDPSKTDDLSVKAPEGDGAADAADAEKPAEAEPVEKKDFTSGLKETTLDEELEKRRARAKKFGLPEDDEAAKLLERAKKFGTDAAPTGPRGLNEALPERRPKRGREAGDEGSRGNFKRRGGGGRGGRVQGRRGGGGGGERRGNDSAKGNAGGSGSSWSAEDKAKAEARKARFAASAPSAS